jgi:transposase
MKGIQMYTKIQEMKAQGFSQNKTADYLGIHRSTVSHYWEMTADEYREYCEKIKRTSALESYRTVIESWICKFPCISAAQICDWLKEDYAENFKERTVSRFVKALREQLGIPKSAPPREYTAVAELPPGKQMQVDFGEMYMPNAGGTGKTKVRFAVFVLSHSRYKFTYFQSRPFHTVDLVTAMTECFRYFDGMPDEIVFDQDSIVCVSENKGDIILTYEFEKFRQQCGFKVYMCRAADPESKGKVENAVRYVKHGFLENRLYPFDDETLNSCAIAWLERTANAKIHGTTRKVPAEVFRQERDYLKPVPITENCVNACVRRTVRKDNTIIYNSNRYSVPIGTYTNQQEVEIETKDGILRIYTVFHEFICEHQISAERGVLVKNKNHDRDTSSSVDEIQQKLDESLDFKASGFLAGIRADKPRYARDQFKLLQSLLDKYGKDKLINAAKFCVENRLFSANTARDFLEFSAQPKPEVKQVDAVKIPIDKPEYHISAAKRSLSVYAKAGEI